MTSVPINLANKFNSSLARSDEPVGSELADIKSEAEGEILTLGNNFSSTSGGVSSDSSDTKSDSLQVYFDAPLGAVDSSDLMLGWPFAYLQL